MGTDIPSMRQGLLLLESVDLRPFLKDLQQPMLWVLSEKDAIIPIALANELKLLQPHAQIVTVPNCGHLPFMTCPEPTAQFINAFLAAQRHD
jgi:pimeloyl-[acyl-carrier protein] methyl ester esterase